MKSCALSDLCRLSKGLQGKAKGEAINLSVETLKAPDNKERPEDLLR